MHAKHLKQIREVLQIWNTHSHSLRVDGQGPPKSERLSMLTPFPSQALSEVL